MADFKPIYRKTLLFEGGFQQFPQDSANYCEGKLIGTNLGISAIAYKQYFGKCPTVQDMKNLTEDTAMKIFKKNYWDKIAGDHIANQSVANLMFQYIIGSGASQISELKRIANQVNGSKILTENDSPIRIDEARSINEIDQAKYHEALKQWRFNFFDAIVRRSPEKGIFLNGWRKRLSSYVYVPDIDPKKKIAILIILFSAVMVLLWKGKKFNYIETNTKYIISLSVFILFVALYFAQKKFIANLST